MVSTAMNSFYYLISQHDILLSYITALFLNFTSCLIYSVSPAIINLFYVFFACTQFISIHRVPVEQVICATGKIVVLESFFFSPCQWILPNNSICIHCAGVEIIICRYICSKLNEKISLTTCDVCTSYFSWITRYHFVTILQWN